MPRRVGCAAPVLALLCGRAASRPRQPQFWRIEGARDFLDGDTEGLSVDSEGRVRLAPASRKLLHDPEAPYVWALARDAKGALYAGTGNDGKVFRIEGGKGTLFFDAPELEVHALAVGPGRPLYVGTSPDGKVYAIDAAGKAETFFDPDRQVHLGPGVRQRRASCSWPPGADGTRPPRGHGGQGRRCSSTSAETHITALAVDAQRQRLRRQRARAASSTASIRRGKVFVLHDSALPRGQGAGGGRRTAASTRPSIDGREKDDADARAGADPPAAHGHDVGAAEVTVTETLHRPSRRPDAGARRRTPRRAAGRPAPGGAQGRACCACCPRARSTRSGPRPTRCRYALVRHATTACWWAPGNKGKLYRVRDDRTWTHGRAPSPREQVTALRARPTGGAVARHLQPRQACTRSSPRPGDARHLRLEGQGHGDGLRLGPLRWEAALPAGTQRRDRRRAAATPAPPTPPGRTGRRAYTHGERRGRRAASAPASSR